MSAVRASVAAQHGAVDREVEPHRQREGRPQAFQRREHPLRQGQTRRRGEGGEEQRFHQQLAHDAPAARAERQADGDFGATIRPAGDEQAGDVGAGDEQHEAHGERQHQQEAGHRADRVGRDAEGLLAGYGDAARLVTDVGPLLRVRLAKGGRDGRELRLRLLRGGVGPQPANHGAAAAAASAGARAGHRLDDEEVEIEPAGEPGVARRRDRDDRGGLASQPDRAADDARIPVEPPQPEAMGEDDARRWGVGQRATRQSPRDTREPEDVEVVRADVLGEDAFGLCARGEAEPIDVRDGETGERRRAAREVHRVEVGRAAVARAAEVAGEDRDEAFRRRDRQRLQQETVDRAEDRGVGADADRQRRDRDEREAGGPEEKPGPEP